MKRVIDNLKKRGMTLSDKRALEFFARTGDWQTSVYMPEVGELYAWEIDPAFESELKRNLPSARVSIGNSFELSMNEQYVNQFDFIVFDNPQNTYGSMGEYCEHFQALPNISRLASKNKECVVIFNVNSNPFDYEKYPEWGEQRNAFYSKKDCSLLKRDFIYEFYTNYLGQLGLEILDMWIEDRDPRYLHYVICIFKKN